MGSHPSLVFLLCRTSFSSNDVCLQRVAKFTSFIVGLFIVLSIVSGGEWNFLYLGDMVKDGDLT